MRRVLFLAYHFPPLGGAGVQRSLKFARYLPEFGYDPVVVTGPGAQFDGWTPIDRSLDGELPDGVSVHRLPGPIPPDGSRARSRLERLAGVRSAFADWWVDDVVDAGLQYPDVDLVYASMAPYESGEAAAALAQRLGVPWVADLRDPWALDEMLEFPSGLHRRWALARMQRLLASADAIVMNTPEAARRLRELPRLRHARVTSVTNGYDGADFERPAPAAVPAFRIVHSGFMHTAAGLERRATSRLRRRIGGLAPVDPLTRSHVFLMEGIGRLLAERPELAGSIEVHLAGGLSDADRAVEGHGLIHEHGYLSHEDSVALVRSADLLFLPMQDLPAPARATIVPGKAYEYLGSGRPLLAAVPDGDARDLLTRVPWARVCRPADSEAMARIVGELVERKLANGREPDGDVCLVADYDRRALTGLLADVFDGVAKTPVGALALADAPV
jgi:glycosyltransferase involved in cell wall biosynthesis